MEYGDSDQAKEVAERTRKFVDEVVVPVEQGAARGRAGHGDSGRGAPRGGQGVGRLRPTALDRVRRHGTGLPDMLPVFEQAGRSLVAMDAMRVAAPDEGNMHLLELVGTDEQKDRWLEPLAAGDIRSGFCMTEPLDGAGSDPKMIRTTARKDGDEWVIDGHKWWTTQGTEADVLIVFARSDPDAHPYEGCSTFLVPKDTDGVDVVRDIPHVGGSVAGVSHAEITFDGVRVPEENLLGDLHEGFQNVQLRLGPARLTHCMRYTGMGQRSLDIAKAYASERQAFDGPLSEKQDLRYRVADAETRLHAVRTMVRHAAERIAEGEQARVPVSMCKVFAANTVQDAIDLSLQVCGGNGIGKDLPIADFYENVRQFRIIDGADEVHKRVIARDAFDDVDSWGLGASRGTATR